MKITIIELTVQNELYKKCEVEFVYLDSVYRSFEGGVRYLENGRTLIYEFTNEGTEFRFRHKKGGE